MGPTGALDHLLKNDSSMSKAVNVTWLSQEDCVEAGAMNMAQVIAYVEKVNVWLSEGKIVFLDEGGVAWILHKR
jgi:hypothetical protein